MCYTLEMGPYNLIPIANNPINSDAYYSISVKIKKNNKKKHWNTGNFLTFIRNPLVFISTLRTNKHKGRV